MVIADFLVARSLFSDLSTVGIRIKFLQLKCKLLNLFFLFGFIVEIF